MDQRGGVSRALVSVAILVFLALFAGAAFIWWAVSTTPAYRLNLDSTTWRVVAIDGNPVPTAVAPLMTFDDSVTYTTPCGTSSVSWAMDTDGAAISFASPQPADATCAPDARQWHDAVAAAMGTIDHWDISSADAIRLIGDRTVSLERVAPR